MRALRHVNNKPRQLGNMRQLDNIKTEINASNHVTITQHIPPEKLHDMHAHYSAIIQAIEAAQELEKLRKLNHIKICEQVAQAKKENQTRCIALSRIIRKRQLSMPSAKRIAQSNHTITRDMAAHGRKLSMDRKKSAIYNLWQAGFIQKRICSMLSYKAPYVSKIIKSEKEKRQPPLF